MCIIKKVFYYKETKLPVIKYKDEIWVKAQTVANILRHKNTMVYLQNSRPRQRTLDVAATGCAKYMRNNLNETV